MNKSEFVRRLANKGYTILDADHIVTDVFDTLAEALCEKEDVVIRGFGRFEVREYAEKEIMTTTGEKVSVPRHYVAKFSPGTMLRRAVSEGIVRGS